MTSILRGRDDQESRGLIQQYGRDVSESRMAFMFPFAEFWGTYFFTLFACGSVLSAGTLTYQFNYSELSAGRLLCISASNGLGYGALLYSMRSLSAQYAASNVRKKRVRKSEYTLRHPVGHFNPAITFAVVMVADLSPQLAATYFFAQMLGAISGAMTVYLIIPNAANTEMGATVPGQGVQVYEALAMEIATTFILTLLTLLFFVVDFDFHFKSTRPNFKFGPLSEHTAPLVIGLTMMMLNFLGAEVSGASMNPARSFAAAIVGNVWADHWVYWAGPYIGAALASVITSMVLGFYR